MYFPEVLLAALAAAVRGGLGEEVECAGDVGDPIGNLVVAVACRGTETVVGIGGDFVNEGDAMDNRGELLLEVGEGAVEAGVGTVLGVTDAEDAATTGNFRVTSQPLGAAVVFSGCDVGAGLELAFIEGVQGLEESLLGLFPPDCLFSVPNDLLFFVTLALSRL